MIGEEDRAWMAAALALARRGLGRTAENPAVGCLIVRDGGLVARARTADGGRPHAEAAALELAGPSAAGATAYVTLEPCAHHGRTPPCADALAAAGIARVVYGCQDPDRRVAGAGLARLAALGVAVDGPALEPQARAVNAGFLSRIERGRPHVALKLATSLDGRIAAGTGASRWITGPEARLRGHALRAAADAVMVGSGTALADDPLLTARLPGAARQPVRIVVDTRLQLSPRSQLAQTVAEAPLWIVTRADGDPRQRAALAARGVRFIDVPGRAQGGVDLAWALGALAENGLNRLLVEGGATLAGALLRAGLVDEIRVMRAGLAIGGDGLGALAPLGVAHPDSAPRFALAATERLGADLGETWTAVR